MISSLTNPSVGNVGFIQPVGNKFSLVHINSFFSKCRKILNYVYFVYQQEHLGLPQGLQTGARMGEGSWEPAGNREWRHWTTKQWPFCCSRMRTAKESQILSAQNVSEVTAFFKFNLQKMPGCDISWDQVIFIQILTKKISMLKIIWILVHYWFQKSNHIKNPNMSQHFTWLHIFLVLYHHLVKLMSVAVHNKGRVEAQTKTLTNCTSPEDLDEPRVRDRRTLTSRKIISFTSVFLVRVAMMAKS